MSEQSETVLAYWGEHRQQMRQSEDQRAALTNYILVIASALVGLAVQQGLTAITVPLTLLVMATGLYGAITVAKYHERADYHLHQARALTQTLKDLGALPADETLLDAHRRAHIRHHGWMYKVRLHALWTGLHLMVAAFGLVLTVICAVR